LPQFHQCRAMSQPHRHRSPLEGSLALTKSWQVTRCGPVPFDASGRAGERSRHTGRSHAARTTGGDRHSDIPAREIMVPLQRRRSPHASHRADSVLWPDERGPEPVRALLDSCSKEENAELFTSHLGDESGSVLPFGNSRPLASAVTYSPLGSLKPPRSSAATRVPSTRAHVHDQAAPHWVSREQRPRLEESRDLESPPL
jgi:hypothetical protein